jgi:catalase
MNHTDTIQSSRPKNMLGLLFLLAQGLQAAPASDLAQRLVDAMNQAPGAQAGHRPTHAKGIVSQGTFTPSREAATVSRAAHFSGAPVPVTVRFSDGGADPTIPDSSPDAAPRGIAIRFASGRGTDIVGISHNGFLVGTGEDLLALLIAKGTTDPAKPHPWPIEVFLSEHPNALKFAMDPKPMPVSFGAESFFANNAFRFVNNKGATVTGRYQIIPVGGPQYLDEAAAKSKSPDFLREELKTRIEEAPVKFRLLLQIAEARDRSDDSSVIWPDDRKKIELGTITLTSVAADSAVAENSLAFDPARLIDGIELSDDPLPALRSQAYAISVARRRSK